MSETARPWRMVRPGTGKVLATIPIIYDAKDHAVAHALGGLDCADQIVTAVNAHDSLTAEVRELRAALEAFQDRMQRFGTWDDGCFYYHGTSASELQDVIEKARAVLAKGGK